MSIRWCCKFSNWVTPRRSTSTITSRLFDPLSNRSAHRLSKKNTDASCRKKKKHRKYYIKYRQLLLKLLMLRKSFTYRVMFTLLYLIWYHNLRRFNLATFTDTLPLPLHLCSTCHLFIHFKWQFFPLHTVCTELHASALHVIRRITSHWCNQRCCLLSVQATCTRAYNNDAHQLH